MKENDKNVIKQLEKILMTDDSNREIMREEGQQRPQSSLGVT